MELITGPVGLTARHAGIRRTDVESAAEMAVAAKQHFPAADLAILSAAVADWRPAQVADIKMKKKEKLSALNLEPTEDILAWMGGRKKACILVGFALETSDERRNAEEKLVRKNLDLIVLNSLNDTGAGFGHDTNKVTFFFKNGEKEASGLLPKADIASIIVQKIKKLLAL